MTTNHPLGSRGVQGVVIAIVSTSIAFVILALRVTTRAIIIRNFGPEDYVIIVSFSLSIVLTALICVEVQHGQGRHYSTISEEDLFQLNKAFWASVPVYQASLCLTKISILLQYLRVFVGPTMRRIIISSVVAITVYGIWSVSGTAFMCTPVAYFWDRSIVGGHCLSRLGLWFSNASLNIITDIGICVLPMPALNKLQLPPKQKYALMAVFGLGAFVCLTSVLRLKSLYDISVSTDLTWDNTPAAYWSSLEANFSIIAACLPTLRKTVARFFPRFFSAYSQTGSRRYNTNTRRTGTDANGFRRFPAHAAEADWVQGLHSQTATAREISHKLEDLRTKGASTSCSSDDETMIPEEHDDGRIRIITTITTREVSSSEVADSVSAGSTASSSPKLGQAL